MIPGTLERPETETLGVRTNVRRRNQTVTGGAVPRAQTGSREQEERLGGPETCVGSARDTSGERERSYREVRACMVQNTRPASVLPKVAMGSM